MSTSPSWFDQEKFSRLVKKVGPKAAPAAAAPASRVSPPRPPEKETRRLQRSLEGASRARTSSVPAHDAPIRATPQEPSESDSTTSLFPPPMPLPEPRSVSPLARRTTALPDLKPIFEYEKSGHRPIPPSEAEGSSAEGEEQTPEEAAPAAPEFPALNQASQDLATAWQTVSTLNEDLSRTAGERDEARSEGDRLRDRVDELDQAIKQRDELFARVEELSHAAEERDDARNEANLLRAQLQQADEIIQASGIPGAGMDELTRTIDERDGARRDYASLREQFESLKKEQGHPQGAGGEAWSGGLTDQEDEINALKLHAEGLENTIQNLTQELHAVQAQLNQARDESSAAQRGLALSQKALQETRDALREASEGFSQNKGNVENLKHECATLVQQNMTLQAQHDQISRELSAARAKLVARG
jgi:uncharacterized phage infection (PIP) family protein YhgE